MPGADPSYAAGAMSRVRAGISSSGLGSGQPEQENGDETLAYKPDVEARSFSEGRCGDYGAVGRCTSARLRTLGTSPIPGSRGVQESEQAAPALRLQPPQHAQHEGVGGVRAARLPLD